MDRGLVLACRMHGHRCLAVSQFKFLSYNPRIINKLNHALLTGTSLLFPQIFREIFYFEELATRSSHTEVRVDLNYDAISDSDSELGT